MCVSNWLDSSIILALITLFGKSIERFFIDSAFVIIGKGVPIVFYKKVLALVVKGIGNMR